MPYLLDLFFPVSKLDSSSLQSRGVSPSHYFDGVLSVFRYHPPLSTYLHDIKYRYLHAQAPYLAELVSVNLKLNYKNILSYWQNNNFTILPVPLHRLRQNWRGFNQSELVASLVARNLNLRYDNTILKRSSFTRPQVKLDDFNRQLHFLNKSIFSLNKSPAKGNFIIFDDVTTTNSTLNACLKPLFEFCDKKPWALTIAG